VQAWKEDYPWLQLAFRHIGPGGRAASEGWRARIEDELRTTLDFKLRPDGTATAWCGMSGYDFHHDPTPRSCSRGWPMPTAERSSASAARIPRARANGRWRQPLNR